MKMNFLREKCVVLILPHSGVRTTRIGVINVAQEGEEGTKERSHPH